MESLLIGSFPKHSSLSPASANLPSLHYAGLPFPVQVPSRHRAWRMLGKNNNNMSLVQRRQPAMIQFGGGRNVGQASALLLLLLFNRKNNTRLYLTNVATSDSPHHHHHHHNGGYEIEDCSNIPPNNRNPWKSMQRSLDAFYRFIRPYSAAGTIISIISVSLLAIEKLSDFSPLFFKSVLKALVAALLINTYVQGFNQLTDIEIDKINKPYFPLASGEYSYATGAILTASCAIMSFWLVWIFGSWPLFWGVFNQFLFGTVYSAQLPMMRWKRHPVLAATAILAMRGLGYQIAYYLHIQTFAFGRLMIFPKPLIFATAIMSLFSVVFALFKDIPDIEGDKIDGIQSFAARFGQKQMFWICICILEAAYVGAISVGASSSIAWSRYITVLGHAALALLVWCKAKSADLNNNAAIQSFYMFIWKLFYAEYLLIPLVR